MRKIRLNLEALAVEGFATEAADEPRGTVRAHSDVNCPTWWGQYTCVGYGSCDPNTECLYTAVDPSCPGVQTC